MIQAFFFSLSQTQQKHIHIQLCPYMERRHGTPTMALTYVATGAAATLASSVCFSRAPAAGASGALFGLLGMECASEARRHGAGHEHAEHAIAIARVTGFALACRRHGERPVRLGGCKEQRHVNFRDWSTVVYPYHCKFKYYLGIMTTCFVINGLWWSDLVT